jgi:hypothetical protein
MQSTFMYTEMLNNENAALSRTQVGYVREQVVLPRFTLAQQFSSNIGPNELKGHRP